MGGVARSLGRIASRRRSTCSAQSTFLTEFLAGSRHRLGAPGHPRDGIQDERRDDEHDHGTVRAVALAAPVTGWLTKPRGRCGSGRSWLIVDHERLVGRPMIRWTQGARLGSRVGGVAAAVFLGTLSS